MSAYREEYEMPVRDQAVKWLCELADDSTDSAADFTAWLRRSPRHVEEFLLATAVWKQLGEVGPQTAVEVAAAIDEARALLATDANVVSLKDAHSISTLPGYRKQKENRGAWRWAIAASVAVALLLAGSWIIDLSAGRSYSTGMGEQKSYTLADGSTISLNVKSRVRVAYSNTARELRLEEGEAMFKVMRDPQRPFRVAADNALIQAVGTQFNVNRRPSGTTVSVIEGAVRILNTAAAPIASAVPTQLGAGEEARIAAHTGRVERQAPVDPAAVAVWRQHRLVFRDDTLEDIVAEFARYTPRRIRLEGEAARNKRLTASFAADDPDSLMLFLAQEKGLWVERRGEEFIVRSASASAK